MTDRKATTVWSGTLFEGSGDTTFDSSGIGTYPVSWVSRAEESYG
jgi:osmotically inducible protein OsmC